MELTLLPPLGPAQPHYGYRPAAEGSPAVSIITPYGHGSPTTGPLFMETVQSVLSQSLQQWEWIIVNDGADDPGALRALLPLRSADERIRVLDQPNRGLSAARNAGVAASRAPLLFFLDSDALLAPSVLEKLAWTLTSHPKSAFATSWSAAFGHENLTWPLGFDTRHAFLYQDMPLPAAMVRRSVFERVGGFDETRRREQADYEFWLRCAAHGLWGHDVREYLIWIRRKAPRDDVSYRWATPDDTQTDRAFRREMRARYPRLFRDGLPRVAAGATLLDTHALIGSDLPFSNCLIRPAGQRRVLLLLPWIVVGGADRFALDLAAGLTARGDRVSVCLLRDVEHTWLTELLRITGDVFNLAAFLRPADYPRFLRYLIESRQITTALISNSLLAYQLLPYLRAHCPSLAVVDFQHAKQEERNGGHPRAGIEHEGLLDLHIVSSLHLRDWMVERGAEADRIEICTTNIDTQRWAPEPEMRARVRAELNIPDNLALILFVGRLSAEKRPRLVAEVLRHLSGSGTPFVCLIAGDGNDRFWLGRFVRRHGMGAQVRLLGAVPHRRVRELLATSDLLLLPSEREGIALTLYEALAMGVVPVAADVGGQRELVTPECGILVPPSDHELTDYVDALRRLIADPALRSRMGQAGRERVAAHFTADQMIDRMRALLDQAAARAAGSPRPPVSPAVGLAAASLAIEHYQLETRLRALLPVRIILALRWTSAWRWLDHIRRLRAYADLGDRVIYLVRREVMRRLRRVKRDA